MKIAHTCLTYLMLTCFNPSTPEEEMDAYILDGHYILQAYATSHWLDHVKEGIRGDTGSQDLMTLIQKIMLFLAKRQNQDFDWKAVREEGVLELKPFEKHQKRLYQELCYINSSLTTELSESLKASKKKSEHPNFSIMNLLPSFFPPLQFSKCLPERFNLALYPQTKTIDPVVCKDDSNFPAVHLLLLFRGC